MSAQDLAEILRKRVSEFGEKSSYVLFPEELKAGKENGLFSIRGPEDRGDGTIITEAVFEGRIFLCVEEKEKK